MQIEKPKFIRETGAFKGGNKVGIFICPFCTQEFECRISYINCGHTKSCGCLKKITGFNLGKSQIKHNMSHTSEYIAWQQLKKRCCVKTDIQYKNYGNRGIRVCDRWLESFENFYEDMGPKPSPELSIERINNDGNYCKENCKWGTEEEQNSNRRTSRYLELDGEKRTVTSWCKKLNIAKTTLFNRLNRGWSVEKALKTPIKKINHAN